MCLYVHGKWAQKSFNLSFVIIYHSFISDNWRPKSREGGNGTKFQLYYLLGDHAHLHISLMILLAEECPSFAVE